MNYKHFTISVDDDGIASIVWNTRNKKLNLLDTETVDDLASIIQTVKTDDAIKGVIISSGKDSFAAGANLKSYTQHCKDLLAEHKDKSEEEISRILFEETSKLSLAVRALETCGKPWVALVFGACMGGGLEIALACHKRIASDDDTLSMALPEIRLGLIPGGGGSQRVPRLCDIQASMEFMMKGKTLSASKAKSMNLIDEIVPKSEMHQRAKEMLQEGIDPVKPWDKKGFTPPSGNIYTPKGVQFWAAANAVFHSETHDNYYSARRLLDTVHNGLSLPMDLALELEVRNFVNSFRSSQFYNMSRTFFFSMNELNGGAMRPKNQSPADVKKIGVIGAGFMGAGIAFVSAKVGIDVVLIDQDLKSAEKGKAQCDSLMSKAIDRGKATKAQKEEMLQHIQPSTSYEDLKDCNLVIEAVFEDRAVKNKVIEAVEAVEAPNLIMASNTSTLPITTLAEASVHPGKFIGIHFFSPVDRMMLVEIIVGAKTNSRTLATAFDYIRKIKKVPIVVNDGRGFYTSRVVMTYVNEGIALLKDGVPATLIENLGKMTGMPVGPLALADEVAIDLSWKIRENAMNDLGDKFVPSEADDVLKKMAVDLKRLGRKNKKGFYEYPEKGKKFLWSGIVAITGEPKPAEELDYNEIKQRLLFIMALETARIYEEKIINDPREADVGSVFGFGFPPYSGGTLSYIDSIGLAEFVDTCKKYEKKWGDRFKPNKLLIDMAKSNKTFYPTNSLVVEDKKAKAA